MTKAPRHLERQALAAHRRGETWATFNREHGDDIRAAEPFSLQRYRGLVDRLAHVVLCGDGDERGTPPWELADRPAQQLLLPIGARLVAVPTEGGGR